MKNYRDLSRGDLPHKKNWLIIPIFIMMDIVEFYGSFWLATKFRNIISPIIQRPQVRWDAVDDIALLGTVLLVIIFIVQNLYPGYGLTAIKELEQIEKAIGLGIVTLSMTAYLYKPLQSYPRSIFPIAWLISSILVPLTRFGMRNVLSQSKIYGIPVIVIGDGEWPRRVVQLLKRARRLGWRPLELHSVADIARNNYSTVDFAILASSEAQITSEIDTIQILNQYFKKVVLVQETGGYFSNWVQARDLEGHLGLEFYHHLLVSYNQWIKRAMDILLSGLLLVLLSPLLLVIILLVKLDSRGPVFYFQERLGQKYKRIRVIKFRTMVEGAEEKLAQLLAENPQIKAQYEEYHKIEEDPRVTRVGRILRKYSLDELPQLLNVLAGEMSLVGPRAYIPAELDKMGNFADTILRVRPGITGWWQIFGRHNTTFHKRLTMDIYYISNWSLWMDIYILMKTGLVVIKGTGA